MGRYGRGGILLMVSCLSTRGCGGWCGVVCVWIGVAAASKVLWEGGWKEEGGGGSRGYRIKRNATAKVPRESVLLQFCFLFLFFAFVKIVVRRKKGGEEEGIFVTAISLSGGPFDVITTGEWVGGWVIHKIQKKQQKGGRGGSSGVGRTCALPCGREEEEKGG